jgi:hypothetical protein
MRLSTLCGLHRDVRNKLKWIRSTKDLDITRIFEVGENFDYFYVLFEKKKSFGHIYRENTMKQENYRREKKKKYF